MLVRARGGVADETLSEGEHVLPPFGRVDVYDLRGQRRDEDLVALAADGAPVEARTSLVTFQLAAGELPALEREVGPDYYRVVVQPIVRAAVRRVLAGYRASELGSGDVSVIEARVTELAAARVRPYHVILESVDLRTLAVVLSPRTYQAIIGTGVLEQRTLAAPQRLAVARQQAAARREEARAVAVAHERVAPTLSPDVLADDARRAEAALLASPHTRAVVVDGTNRIGLEVDP